MSFILEALKKSEKDKQKVKKLPDVYVDGAGERGRPKKRLWPYVLAAVLVVNGAVLAVLLNNSFRPSTQPVDVTGTEHHGDKTQIVAPHEEQPATATEEVRSERKKESDAPPARSVRTIPHDPSRPGSAGETASPPKQLQPEDADRIPREKKQEDASAPRTGADGTVPAPALSPRGDDFTVERFEDFPSEYLLDPTDEALLYEDLTTPPFTQDETVDGGIDDTLATAGNGESAHFEQAGPPEPSAVPSLGDNSFIRGKQRDKTAGAGHGNMPDYGNLPESLRGRLPELSLSVHYFEENPTVRFVTVNGKMRKQGDKVADDLIVEEITKQGVVFNFKGEKFYMAMF